MCKKLMFLISFVSLLGLVGSASATDRTWTNAYPWSMLWSSAQNWDPVGVPAPDDKAYINPGDVDPLAPAIEPNQGPVVDSNMEVGEIRGPRDGGSVAQTMRILAGDVIVNDPWYIGESGTGTATVEISGGNVETDDIRGMREGVGVLDVKGDAEVNIKRFKNFAERDQVTATINVSENATLFSRENCDDSFRSDVVYAFNVSDSASFIVDNEFKPGDDDSVGTLHVTDDAYLYVDDEWEMCNPDDGSDPYITVIFDGNAVVEGGERLRINGSGELLITDNAEVTIDRYVKMADEENYCYVTMDLSGNGILTINGEDNDRGFWFGDEGTGELNISGNASMYVEYDAMFPRDSALAATFTMTGGEFTCAREVRIPQDGSCTFSMTGGDFIADELTVGRADGTLAYMDGGLADVGEFSHEDNYLMDFTGGMLKIDGDRYDDIFAEVLAGRITGYGGCGGRGDIQIDYDNISAGHTLVWASSNPYRAWDPTPVCGATDQDPNLDLMWNAGDNMDPTDLHHVFLSPDFDCVNTGLLMCWLDDTSGTTMNTGDLQLATTYYWRVESHDLDEPRFTEGQVWSFSTVDGLVQDDMEDYDDVTNPIWDSWHDGCGDAGGAYGNGTGSCVYIGTDQYHGDNSQSMLYYYDNSGQDIYYETRDCNYSIATHTFDAPQDWTLYGAEILELWFYGDLDNDATALEAMFVVVHDSDSNAMVVYGSRVPELLSDMQEPEWQRWDIPLSVFADLSVDLTDVVAMQLGFGDRTNCHREPGGFGTMYIDDIALLPHQCIPKYTPDIYDINGDCVVDWGDVETYCDNYLTDER